MLYLLLAVLCSVLVSVLLKLARRHGFDISQAIAWNYLATACLSLLVLQPPLAPLKQATAPWPALLALGVLLPTIFLALAASVRHAGIVRSDTAQRLSLLLPLMAAFVLFGETVRTLHVLGCALGLLALLAMVWRSAPAAHHADPAPWRWPLLVFVGFGIIDVLFKHVAASGLPLGSALLAMFALALLLAFVIALSKRTRFTLHNALGGLLLGLCNFGNILFYLRAHRALPQQPSLVFASMNLGVVVLGSLVGVLAFKEHLSRINRVGLLLALLAIVLLTHA